MLPECGTVSITMRLSTMFQPTIAMTTTAAVTVSVAMPTIRRATA